VIYSHTHAQLEVEVRLTDHEPVGTTRASGFVGVGNFLTQVGTEIKCAGYKIIIPARTDSSRRNYRWQSFNGHLRDTGKSHRKKEEAIHGCLSARQRFISVEGNAVWRAKYHLTHSNTRKT